jgi:transcriptional regulator with XRE-family HTH domain
MMDLSTYLAQTGTSQRAFAEKVGISPSFLNEIVQGTKAPSLAVAIKIAEAADGAVSMASLVKGAA